MGFIAEEEVKRPVAPKCLFTGGVQPWVVPEASIRVKDLPYTVREELAHRRQNGGVASFSVGSIDFDHGREQLSEIKLTSSYCYL